ncbi:MAG: hypothetical protein PHH54_01180 [Candidatus Nanoarchaeia archaeon]|nr:hypothetical protein [Candidatus Nanoarchaeia archaeon]MDD5740576.1 hypothetical protein [Candidatus Nanoarchaeia archaeon]
MIEETISCCNLEKIRESNLIGRCIKFAEQGRVTREVYAWHTHYHASNSRGKLRVTFNDGVNSQGGGDIKVNYNKENVFYASVDPLANFVVIKYIPGEWENCL